MYFAQLCDFFNEGHKMIYFRADEQLNALFVTISGAQTKEKMAEQIPVLMQTCAKLKDGFFIITDLSMTEVKSDNDYAILNKVSQKLVEKFNLGHVIRIYGPKSVHKSKLEKLDQKLNITHVHYVKNKNEALQLASSLK